MMDMLLAKKRAPEGRRSWLREGDMAGWGLIVTPPEEMKHSPVYRGVCRNALINLRGALHADRNLVLAAWR